MSSTVHGIRGALSEALDRTRLTPEEKIRRIQEIVKRSQAIEEPILTDDDLYDEWGMPK